MSTFKEYINGYAFGVKSLLVGMKTSMKVFMRKTGIPHCTYRNATAQCW